MAESGRERFSSSRTADHSQLAQEDADRAGALGADRKSSPRNRRRPWRWCRSCWCPLLVALLRTGSHSPAYYSSGAARRAQRLASKRCRPGQEVSIVVWYSHVRNSRSPAVIPSGMVSTCSESTPRCLPHPSSCCPGECQRRRALIRTHRHRPGSSDWLLRFQESLHPIRLAGTCRSSLARLQRTDARVYCACSRVCCRTSTRACRGAIW